MMRSAIDREARQQRLHAFAHCAFYKRVLLDALLRKYVQHLGDQAADGLKFLHAKAARGASGRAEPDAGSHRRFFGVERNFVLVASDVRATQRFLRDLATEALRPEI